MRQSLHLKHLWLREGILKPKWACGVYCLTRSSVMAEFVYYRDSSCAKYHVRLRISDLSSVFLGEAHLNLREAGLSHIVSIRIDLWTESISHNSVWLESQPIPRIIWVRR